MTRKHGFDLLAEQVANIVSTKISVLETCWTQGDTPIEKLFSLSLWSAIHYGETIYKQVLFSKQDKLVSAQERCSLSDDIIAVPQAKLGRKRVDFLIYAYGHWILNKDKGSRGWRTLIVECDGHDFHERTKEQVAKDRARDRSAVLEGIEVFRFTGSELWRDPIGCANQVIDWATRGA
jgi:hypothetical protein